MTLKKSSWRPVMERRKPYSNCLARHALVKSVPLPGKAFSTSAMTELGLKMTK